jgi:hypothetical protein
LAAATPDLGNLDAQVSVCRACPRLVAWREETATVKRRAFAEQPHRGTARCPCEQRLALGAQRTVTGHRTTQAGGGQTREHAALVRSFGVQQLVVAVNKLDAAGWSRERFEAVR